MFYGWFYSVFPLVKLLQREGVCRCLAVERHQQRRRLEMWSNTSGLTFKCKVMNLIRSRNFCCKLEPHWLSLTEGKDLSV